jgi:hypothetical protein
MDKKALFKRISAILGDVLLFAFIGICCFVVVLTIVSKKDVDGTANVFGYQLRFVKTASMEKCDLTYDEIKNYKIKDIPVNSLLFIETVPEDDAKALEWYSEIEVGDVLTFKYVYDHKQETITHRVTEITEQYNADNVLIGYNIVLMGDNRDSDDGAQAQYIYTYEENALNYVVGKVVSQNRFRGILAAALKTPLGLILVVMVPCSFIIITEVVRVVNLLNAEKKAKAERERSEKQKEIDDLREKLRQLEEAKALLGNNDSINVIPQDADNNQQNQ